MDPRLAAQTLLDQLPVAAALVDREFRYLAHSRRWTTEFAQGQSTLLGRSHLDLWPDFAARWGPSCERCLRDGTPSGGEQEMAARAGGSRWFRWEIAAWRDDGGAIGGLLLRVDDVTREHKASMALQESAERLERAEAVAGLGHWWYDLATGRVTWSRGLFELYGYDRASGEPDYAGVLTDYEEESARRLDEAVRNALVTGDGYCLRLTLARKEARARHVRADAHVRRNAEGGVLGLFGTVLDISELVRHEKELEEARRAAERASLAKSDFLAVMSHEVRTPLSGVLGFCELLLDTRLDDLQREHAITIKQSGERLLEVVNDILDFSKIEAGHTELERVPYDARRVASEVLELQRPAAEAKKLQLTLLWDDSAPRIWLGDSGRVRQVLLNLLGNAIKFTPTGSVSIQVDRPETARVRVRVIDSGLGIAADDLPRLFTKFTQAPSSNQRRTDGSGLGLAICKKLVELMGGEIGVSSERGSGSTFWFTLPAPGQQMEGEGECRVLVVDDNLVNQRLVSQLLQQCGCRVDLAGDGQQAVLAFRESPYDLVFMDLEMPEMNGFEATAAIRELESLGSIAQSRNDTSVVASVTRTPIVAITSSVEFSDRERCLRAGMDDFIAKPLRREEIERALARWVG